MQCHRVLFGGAKRNRTAVAGFADLCLTARPSHRKDCKCSKFKLICKISILNILVLSNCKCFNKLKIKSLNVLYQFFFNIVCNLIELNYLCLGVKGVVIPCDSLVISFSVINYVVSQVIRA